MQRRVAGRALVARSLAKMAGSFDAREGLRMGRVVFAVIVHFQRQDRVGIDQVHVPRMAEDHPQAVLVLLGDGPGAIPA